MNNTFYEKKENKLKAARDPRIRKYRIISVHVVKEVSFFVGSPVSFLIQLSPKY